MEPAKPSAPEPPSAPAGRAPVRWNRARRAVAAALAAAFAVLLPASITSAWIRGTILSTSGYVAAVTPVATSPAVRAAVQDAVTSQVDAALIYAETSLPPSTRVLAGLLGTGLAGFARNGVRQLMASQAFQRLWADANRLAHSQLISVLNGDSALVTATGGEVVLNLLPLVNDVLRAASGPLPAMTGGAGPLPPVTTVPAAACHAVTGTASSACTQIPLFPATALAGPRHAYRILVAILPLVLMLTTFALAGALAASPRRRRTLLQMTIGGTLTVLTVMTAVSWGQSSLIDRGPALPDGDQHDRARPHHQLLRHDHVVRGRRLRHHRHRAAVRTLPLGHRDPSRHPHRLGGAALSIPGDQGREPATAAMS
jgi:hypothetical protein